MAVISIVLIVFLIPFNVVSWKSNRNLSCGVDNSPLDVVYEGAAAIDTYPWLGYLFYPVGKKRYTTVVVLVTKQVVLGTATEIDKLPKRDFRVRARVVLGRNCSQLGLRVREYIYHPDFGSSTYSALAMVQLDLDNVNMDTLRPICPPPTHVIDPDFYAMTLSDECKRPVMRLYEMKFVDPVQCKKFYRKSGVGFGVYGPGCEAPARFLDYGMYHQWVRQNVLRIGRPTITRIGGGEIILRRSLLNLQRYGPCDLGEMKTELYTDYTTIRTEKIGFRRVRYNMTIYADTEYSCVVFRVRNQSPEDKAPQLRLRRWCAGTLGMCSNWQHLQIDFYVEITFAGPIYYALKAYGQRAKMIDPRRAMVHVNSMIEPVPIPDKYEVQSMMSTMNQSYSYIKWYSRHFDEKIMATTTSFPPIDPRHIPYMYWSDGPP